MNCLDTILTTISELNRIQSTLQKTFSSAITEGSVLKSRAMNNIFDQRLYAQYLDNTARLQASLKDVADAIDNLCLIRSDAPNSRNLLK